MHVCLCCNAPMVHALPFYCAGRLPFRDVCLLLCFLVHCCHSFTNCSCLQRRVRDNRASYLQSLDVLRAAKACGVYTKSSIMLGLGETDDEVIDTLVDLRDCGVDIVTFGQYLQPTPRHLEVKEFVTPAKFEYWRKYGEEELGFRCAVTSSNYRGL
jgi:lipoate synthase